MADPASVQETIDALTKKEAELQEQISKIRNIRQSLELTVPTIQKRQTNARDSEKPEYENVEIPKTDPQTFTDISKERIEEIHEKVLPQAEELIAE